MDKFKKFTQESVSKNDHLEHLEDEVFNQGIPGVRKALDFIIGLKDMLHGHVKTPVNVTVKWDGAPAIICGKNPENKKFFVGTKSVFNKTEPKINYTNADIDRNYPDQLQLRKKLKAALLHLKKLDINGVVQGELLYTRDDLNLEYIDGSKHLTFTPNTITYAVPFDSALGTKIKLSKLGIVFHTKYVGNSLSTMKATFNVSASQFKKTTQVWVTDATFRDESGTATLTAAETRELATLIKDIELLLKRCESEVINRIAEDENIKSLIKMFINSRIRIGEGISGTLRFVDGLVDFISARYEKEILALKTEGGKEKRRVALQSIKKLIETNSEQLVIMFLISEYLAKAKQIVIRKLQSVKDIGTFIKTENGFKVTAPEGFVAIDNITGGAVKLVDRLEFSKANFDLNRFGNK